MTNCAWRPLSASLLAALLASCGAGEPREEGVPAGEEAPLPPGAQALSLLGEPLHPPPIPDEARIRMEEQLAEARGAYESDPDDAEAIIWLGRRTAYLARYREAVEIFTEGIEKHPDDPRMYRHRGHRYITLRELDRAIHDLSRAGELTRGRPDEVEPDGMPNPAGIPRSTLQSNIWYHLALAHYLRHDFEAALAAWLECLGVSGNDDMHVATADWLYMTYRRLGREEEAEEVLEPIHRDMAILENHAYHRRLLMYRGEIDPEELLDVEDADPVQTATYGYGVGNWYLYNGDPDRAVEIFRRIREGPNWAAFGYIAAEAELAYGGLPATTAANRSRTSGEIP